MRPPRCSCGECKYCKKRQDYLANKGDRVPRATAWARNNRERHNASVRSWKERNPDKVRSYWKKRNDRLRGTPEQSRIHRTFDLKRHYGITPEWWDAKFKEQKESCGICGCTENNANNRRFHVDHCHTSGQNRGLLCHRCNTALERLEDVENWLSKAQAYLDRYEKEYWESINARYSDRKT
jgi:hypothetical protein